MQLKVKGIILNAKNAIFCIKIKNGQTNAKHGAKRTIAAIWKLQSMQSNPKMPKLMSKANKGCHFQRK